MAQNVACRGSLSAPCMWDSSKLQLCLPGPALARPAPLSLVGDRAKTPRALPTCLRPQQVSRLGTKPQKAFKGKGCLQAQKVGSVLTSLS